MSETANQMAEAFEAEAGTAPVVNVSGVDAPAVTQNSNQKFYTEADLAKVRSQEKDKLYPQIEELKTKLSSLEKEREEEAARKAALAAEQESRKAEAEDAKLKEELSAKDYAELSVKELREQLERERQERESAFALWEREKQFADLQSYKQNLLEAERDNIMPQLLKYVQGNTREELDAAIADVKAQTADILESTQAALGQQRREQVGTRATLPPAGPLETNMEQRQLTPQEIAAMPMNEYAKYREKLMSPSARGITRGILG